MEQLLGLVFLACFVLGCVLGITQSENNSENTGD